MDKTNSDANAASAQPATASSGGQSTQPTPPSAGQATEPAPALPAGQATQPAPPASQATEPVSAQPVKKTFFTWERTIEILKLLATVWVAVLGSVVTMQFNERQHELNRIEAIAQMLPHMAANKGSDTKDSAAGAAGESDAMSRDGAIWAIFRTASNRTMLRDLASLFPEDIYRVVSSIASTGELDGDHDAAVALQVSSEKLAAKYANDPKHAELANRLYAQAARLKERAPDDTSPLQVIDLTTEITSQHPPTDDRWASLIRSINDLADAHIRDSQTVSGRKRADSNEWEARKLYQRARQLGSTRTDPQVVQQVIRADLALGALYVKEQLADDAFKSLKEALESESKITGTSPQERISSMDKDKNGYASLAEIDAEIKAAQERLKQESVKYADQGAELK